MDKRSTTVIFVLVLLCSVVGQSYAHAPTTVIAECPKYVVVDDIVQFDGSGSYDDDGTITEYDWDFPPDANNLYGETTAEPNCVFNVAGIYSVRMKVKDNWGYWSSYASCNVFVSSDPYRVHNIAQDTWYSHIQLAINDANVSDELEVQQGTCYEFVDFDGKDVILRSPDPNDWEVVAATIIDANHMSTVVTFYGTESSDCKLLGLTITNGYGSADVDGGGIDGDVSGPHTQATVTNCIIRDNVAQRHGGGIQGFNGLIDKCKIFGNSTVNRNGGGLSGCDGTIRNCLIYNNMATLNGGGMVMCNGDIVNCTIVDNTAGASGGGMAWCGDATITNCIIWGNNLEQVAGGAPTYSCIQNWASGGTGNISSDPMFVNSGDKDFHLDANSPCINVGDLNRNYAGQVDIDGEQRVKQDRVDIGADEACYWFVNLDGSRDFVTIQAAVDNAVDGDIVIVELGTYTGDGNRDIDFGGKAIAVQSIDPGDSTVVATTMIDCNGTSGEPHRGFYFHNGEESTSKIAGFTITGGYGNGSGGGIVCQTASPTIANCVITGNRAPTYGGGIFCYTESNPIIIDCLIAGNSSTSNGGGMYNKYDSSPSLVNCVFTGNLSNQSGGGVYNYSNSNATFTNCTFSGNTANSSGGGIYSSSSSPMLTNCILWGNSDSSGTGEVAQIRGGTPLVTYSCIQDDNSDDGDIPFSGSANNNIDGYPMFANPGYWNGSATPSFTIQATVRDFSDNHPDFELANYDSEEGIVGPIGADIGDDRKPVYAKANDPNSPTTSGEENFNQWYNDTAGVNMTTTINLELTPKEGAVGVYEYRDQEFFPIDGRLLENEGRSHNFHFTLELHTKFTYRSGDNQNFELVEADDDLFIYVDGKLVIDLGGVHPAQSASVNLDMLVSQGILELEDGKVYDFDLFFAERHTSASHLVMETSIVFSEGDYHLRADSPCIDTGNNSAVPSEITTDSDGKGRITDGDDNGSAVVDMGAYEYPNPNNPPEANDDEYTAHKNIMLTIGPAGVLENDSDPDDDPMTVVLETDVSSGILVLDSDGSFDYTPPAGFVGQVTFTYKAVDDKGAESDAVTVTINVVNDAPVAEPDSDYEMFSTNTMVIDAAGGLLVNDTDDNNDDLTAQLEDNVPDGSSALSLNPDGSFTFNPNDDHSGPITFTYKAVDDSQAESDPATVTINLIKLTASTEPVHINLSSTDTVNLDGTIEGGSVDSVQWYVTALTAKSSADVEIGGYTKENPDTTATFTEPGRYSIYLGATKNQITGQISGSSNEVDILVESTINEAPKAEAGENQVITWPNNTVNLDGSYTDDGLPYGQVKPTWSILSSTGGGSVEFGDPNSWDTTATFSKPDTYVLQLEADDYAESGYDTCRVVVEERFDPNVYAGADATIALPHGAESVSYTFEKDGTGANGVYVRDHTGADYSGGCTITWDVVAGLTSAVSFEDETLLGTTVTFTAPGPYVLRLTATADDTLSDYDVVAIEVTGEYPLEVYAGADRTVFLPGIAELAGEVLKGEPDTTTWSLVEGSGLITFEDPNSLTTEVRFNWPGTYVFELKAESDWGEATDEVEIEVRTMMVAGGPFHTLFLDENGILWACGKNTEWYEGPTGVLGVGSEKDQESSPMRVVGLDGQGFLENIVSIDAGHDLSLAVDKDGHVWAWGSNRDGQLGRDKDYGDEAGQIHISATPVQVVGENEQEYLADIVKVAAFTNTALALDKNGHVWAWGGNYNAKLGIGSYAPACRTVPAKVMRAGGVDLEDIIDIDVSWGGCTALDKQGRVWSWGSNFFREPQGDPNYLMPKCVLDSDPNRTESPEKIVDVAVGAVTGYALTKAGEVWSWGSNQEGQRGCGENGCESIMGKVVSGGQDKDEPDGGYCSETLLKDIIAISAGTEHAIALEKNGRMWLWGYWGVDISGYFCSGPSVCHGHMYEPVEVTNRADSYNLTGVSYIYASPAGSYAIDSDGWLWMSGCNNYGQLGLGFSCAYPGCSAYGTGYPMDVPLPRPLPLGRVVNVTQGKRYSEIQRAINEAAHGDEIVVYEGYFSGNVSFPNDGRDIILRSSDPYNLDVVANTIIDGRNRTNVDTVTITGDSIIDGFTVINGSDGISCDEGSRPVITNNIIRDNRENGISCYEYSSPLIENNRIVNNGSGASDEGDGINFHKTSTSSIRNNTIVRNYRYGITRESYSQYYQPEIINCIIWSGGADKPSGYPDDPNCLLFNCPDPNYCCIENLPPGVGIGNINADPCFVDTDPNVNDYHLKPNSPCIGAGDPYYISISTDIDGEPRIMGARVDIGADEYAPLKVEAGADKHTTLTKPHVQLSDASVLYNGLPEPPGVVTVQWSRIQGPSDGVTFDDAGKVKATATFCMAGTYVLKLTAYEDDCIAGVDTVTIDVGLGVEAGPTQIIDISDPNAVLSGDLIEFSCAIGLQARWRLNGDANDSAGDHDGTPAGDATFIEDTERGWVLSLDSAGNGYVRIDGYKGISGTQGRTVCAWIKTDTDDAADIISWGTESAGQRWLLYIDEAGKLGVDVSGGYIQTGQDASLQDGNWHHIAATWEKGPADDDPCDIKHARLYIDGQDPNFYVIDNQSVNTGNSADVKIGILEGQNRYFNGQISDVRIYDCALTETYIRNLEIETKWSHRGKDQLVTFMDDSYLATKATFDRAGAYKLKLDASNSAGEQLGTDSVTIIVENPRYVSAGADRAITLPTDRVELAGEIAGVVPHSVWWYSDNEEKVTFDVPVAEESRLASGAQFAEPGTYTLALVAKNKWGGVIGCDTLTVTVDPQAVSVEAGQDIMMPNTTRVVNLGGSASGSQIDFVRWEFGGSEISFGDPCDVDTWAVFAVDAQGLVAAGDYKVALVAHNAIGGVIGADTLIITVTGEPEDPVYQPAVTVEATGNYSEITWPDDTVTLSGAVTGDAGYQWFDSSGKVTFGNAAGYETTAQFSESGTYNIELLVEAGSSYFLGADVIEITVHEPNLVVGAGNDQTIILPDGAYLAGSIDGVLADGAQVHWQCESDLVTIENPDVPANTEQPEEEPKAIFDREGMYVIELVITYQDLILGSDRLVVTARQPEATVHITDVEPGTTISLPDAHVHVSAEVFAIELNAQSIYEFIPNITYEWIRPDPSASVDTNSPADELHPSVTFSQKGEYSLRLNVYKSGPQLIGWDEVTITVLPENQPPHVEAGSYPAKILPTEGNVELTFDPNVTWCIDDGLPDPPAKLEYRWSKTDGPAVVISDPCELLTKITFDQVGEYEFDLMAFDDQHDDHDTLTIYVYPADQPVHVYAGSDKTVTLPFGRPMDDAFAIIGEGMSLEWSVVNQPAGATVLFHPSEFVQNPLVTFNIEAESDPYELQLAVKDGGGQIVDANQVQVWVFDPCTPDATPPEITTFTATQNNVPIDPCTPVFGDVRITAVAEDYDSGLASMKLELEKTGGEPNTLKLIEDLSSSSPVMRMDFILHTYLWESGAYTLRIIAANGYGLEAQKELELSIPDPASAGLPVAEITNIVSQLYNTTSDGREGVRPQVITEGFFELEGIAFHPDYIGQVNYKVDLFKGPAGAYAESCWNSEPLKSDYFVKTMIPLGVNVKEVGPEAGSLGTLDFTTVLNGSYQLLLTVEINAGTTLVKYASAGFILDCPLKIGNVKFTQEDVVIPVGGVPLRVVRTYDSFNKDKDSEFGYGWSYSIANMDIELDEDRLWLNLEDSTEGRSVRWGSNFDRNVTLTLPDGRRTTFMFYLDVYHGDLYSGELDCYIARYEAPPGVNATLETSTAELFKVMPFVEITEENEAYTTGWNGLYSNQGGEVKPHTYDFGGYMLTTEDGMKYRFEREDCFANENDWKSVQYGGRTYLVQPRGPLYLSHITTPNAETIDFNVDEPTLEIGQEDDKGVEHKDKDGTATKAIKIDYDDKSRIGAIYAPSEIDDNENVTIPTVWYEYDDYGNLEYVHKLVEKNDPCTPDKDLSDYETITYVYDDDDNDPQDHYVTDIVDPRGLAPVRYVYDDNGRLEKVIDAKGEEITLGHEVGQRNEVVEDRLGNITIYTYNDRGNVVRLRDALGNVTMHTYDEGSDHQDDVKATTVIMPDEPNRVTRYDYVYYSDGKLRKHTVFDQANNLSETHYDEIGNVKETSQWRLTDPCDADPCYPNDYVEVARSENTYYWRDGAGDLYTGYSAGYAKTNLLWATEVITHFDDPCDPEDKERIERTEYEYDDDNKLQQVKKVDAADPCNVLQVVSTYAYDQGKSNSADQPYSINDAAGFTQYFYYDENGNQTESWYYWSDPADPCNPATVSTITEYDAAGRVKRTWRQVSNATGNVQDYTVLLSETQYNSIGKVDWAINEHGVLTKYEYDESGSLVETIVYESKAAYDAWYWDYPNSFGGVLTISRTLYDAEGRVHVSVGSYDPCETVNGTENIYDAVGRIVETKRWADVEIQMADITDEGTLIGRKSTDWTKEGAEPLSYSRTEYDPAGRVKSTYVLDEEGVECQSRYEYDLAGKQIKVIDPNFNVTETHYLGNRRDWIKDARGNVTYFDYDAVGRAVKTTYPTTQQNPQTYTYVKYDNLGRKKWESEQTAEVDPNDALGKEFVYDAAGRLVKVILPEVTDPNNNDVLTRPVYKYVYDIYGNQIAIVDPYDRITVFSYDEFNRLVRKYMPFLADWLDEPTADDIYALDLTDKLYEERSYNTLGQLEIIIDYKGQVIGYFYDGIGRLQFKEYYNNYTDYPDTAAEFIEYTYDKLSRKMSETLYEVDGGQLVAISWSDYEYDTEGNVVKVDTSEGTVNYSYNDITRRKSSTWTANTATDYSYDMLGRTSSVTAAVRNGAGVNKQTFYEYNEVGSRKSITLPNNSFTEYQYNACNWLTKVSNKDSSEAILSEFDYTHFANGMREGVEEKVDSDENVDHYIGYGYDALNRLTQESNYDDPCTASAYGYTSKYVYGLAGNRKYREVNVNGADINTEYIYDPDTDQLRKEINTDQPLITMMLNDRPVYAYADGAGGFTYKLSGMDERVGPFSAFILGLPSVWSRYVLLAVAAGLVLAILCPLLAGAYRRIACGKRLKKKVLAKAFRNCLIFLLAYVFFVGPESFQVLAQADIDYSTLTETTWGKVNDAITYFYDANGSLKYKFYGDVDIDGVPETIITNNPTLEYDYYEYNLQGRFSALTKSRYEDPDTVEYITEYVYNPQGLRVRKIDYENDETTVYLQDLYNHTGYVQVLEEITFEGVNVDPLTDTPTGRITYTIGDDVISQADENGVAKYFIYDGHGSTRQLQNSDESIAESYDYDAYGIMLQSGTVSPPAVTSAQGTSLLYAGEMFDFDSQHYYNRARWYNPYNGRFNRMDPFAGSPQDPQSLHKYLYAHCNPINNIDPSGEFTLVELLSTITTIANAFIKYYWVLRTGLIVADILTAANIVIKAMTSGISSVTAGEWTKLALITATAFFGGKVARRVAKGLIRRVLKIPIGTLRSFKVFRRFVESKGILVEVSDLMVFGDMGQEIGNFDLVNKGLKVMPKITLNRGGHTVSTLLHEFVHYNQWKLFVGALSRHDWQNFMNIPGYYKNLEDVAKFVGKVFLK